MLFLFDIDGTLLRRMPPAHRQALCDAALTVFGVDVQPDALKLTAGQTDTTIAMRMLQGAGVPAADIAAGLPAFFQHAADAYTRLVPADLHPYHTPAAEETLRWLAERGAHLALVTGNIERVAWTKLRAAGLADYFTCGAFGDESATRADLPPLARARAAAAFGRPFAAEETYVVGDTPEDIACGVASRCRTVAVATGPIHSLDDLRACSPDYAFADLHGLRTLEM